MSCKHNSSLADTLILMKLYTVEVHNLRMCLKEIVSSAVQVVTFCDICLVDIIFVKYCCHMLGIHSFEFFK